MQITLDQYLHPKMLLQLKKEGIVKNNVLVVNWKQVKRIEKYFSTICYNGTKEDITQEMRFINQENKIMFQVRLSNSWLPVSPDDFLFFSELFMKCNGITLGPLVSNFNPATDFVQPAGPTVGPRDLLF